MSGESVLPDDREPVDEREGVARLVGVEINYADRGPLEGRPLLLVMGLGMQRVSWPDSLLDALVERGFRCITFDNRDAGLSTHYRAYGAPSLPLSVIARLIRRHRRLPYRLADIADDAVGLLAHLGIASADICGISMGGMVAQHIAHRHPESTRTLTLMCTTSGRLGLPPPRRAVLQHMRRRPQGEVGIDEAVRYSSELFRLIGSPAYPVNAADIERRVRHSLARSNSGAGVMRQLATIINDGDRSPILKRLKVPTLILHGSADPLVPPAHGEQLARIIPDARIERIQGWGHDLPDALAPLLSALIAAHSSSSQR